MPQRRAREVLGDIVDRAPDAIAAAQDETSGLPSEVPALVTGQLAALRSVPVRG
ncbi:MAG: hypothetical protein ACRD2C_15860 [Acidimicrobiales bacterium]